MSQTTVLCLASYFKGEAFMRQAKKEGARVFLLTEEKLAHEKWPRESLDEVFLMPVAASSKPLVSETGLYTNCSEHLFLQ